MDESRFDNLARVLAGETSRRRLVRGLIGSAVGGVAAFAGRGEAGAQRLPLGSACTRATRCASFHCVDGVCCDSACTGQCEACSAQGVCGPVAGAPVGDRPACPGDGACRATCDGVTRTTCAAYPAADVVCADPVCANGWQTTYSCGGNGNCHPTTSSCEPYVCDAAGIACLISCTNDDQCAGNAFCLNGACVEERPLGEPCTAGGQCASGVCAQGVCCAGACPGGCRACNVPGNEGFCTEIPDGGPCDGGACCDGECVDTSNSLEHCGQCDHACRLVPAPGSCENEPICQEGLCTFTPQPGPDLVLCRDAVDVCDVAEFCPGDAVTCPDDAFQPATFECRQASCADGVATLAANCRGDSATCPDPVTVTCGADHVCAEGTCLACGYEGAPCCAGDTCPDPDDPLTCVGGICRDCGGHGEPCCPGNACSSDDDRVCLSGLCVDCGQTGEPCCAGDTCVEEGQTCVAGLCQFCGFPGEPCCPGNVCADELDCQAGFCLTCVGDECEGTCGFPGEPCCEQNACEDARWLCVESICIWCGFPGEPCCPGDTCGSDDDEVFVCVAGFCVDCGGDGEPCCPGNTCNDSAICQDNLCLECGGTGEPCCAGNTCPSTADEPAFCENGVCRACGNLNELCCPGNDCNEGSCTDGACR